jgi:hypothetical protein
MRRRVIGLATCVVAMTLVPLSSQALPACGSWAIVSSPNVDPTLDTNQLYDVTAISSSSAWAVGKHYYAESPGAESTLAEHWNGTAWEVVPTPNATDVVNGTAKNQGNRLNAVTAISGSNIWAVGAHGTIGENSEATFVPLKTLVEHWNGTAWQIITSPNVGTTRNELNGLVAFSASNIWAVGSYSNGSLDGHHDRPLAAHWNGTAWKTVAVPSYGTSSRLYGVAKIPGTSKLWAVGEYEKVNATTGAQTSGALIEKWNGSSWSVAATTSNSEKLNSVTAISSSSAFAVGDSVMRWNGTSWNVMSNALPSNNGYAAELESVTRAPNGNLLAAGWRIDPQTLDYSTVIERWDGSTWSVVPSPNQGGSRLYGIAKAPNSTRVWAVGVASGETLVETYC